MDLYVRTAVSNDGHGWPAHVSSAYAANASDGHRALVAQLIVPQSIAEFPAGMPMSWEARLPVMSTATS